MASLKDDIAYLLKGKGEINPDVFINPQKYTVRLSISKVVADSKVSKKGVEFYKQKIANKEKIKPIIVVKHPTEELYAVLDGHHRYFAQKEMGRKRIYGALAGDYSSVIFYLTKKGYFQPNPEVRESIRSSTFRLHENLQQFLNNFLKNIHKKPKKTPPKKTRKQ